MPSSAKARNVTRATSTDELDEIVSSVLAASRVLVGVAVRSLDGDASGVTVVQFRALASLHTNGPGKVGALADHLGVNASTAVRTIDRLLAGGLVTREENPGNRREKLVGLTTEGRRVVSRVTARRRKLVADIVRRMPDASRDELVSGLHGFAGAAGSPAPPPGDGPVAL